MRRSGGDRAEISLHDPHGTHSCASIKNFIGVLWCWCFCVCARSAVAPVRTECVLSLRFKHVYSQRATLLWSFWLNYVLSGETRERTEGRAFVEKENVTNFSCCYSIIFSMYRYSADYRVSVKRTGKMFSSLV